MVLGCSIMYMVNIHYAFMIIAQITYFVNMFMVLLGICQEKPLFRGLP